MKWCTALRAGIEKEAMKMQKTNLLTIIGLVFCLAGLVTTSWAEDSGNSTPAIFPASAFRGEKVYEKACTACHGDNGDGNGSGAAPLNPKPRDFTKGIYKFHSTPIGELPTDADLLRILTNGIPHSQMPAWNRTLTEQERVDVVAYIKGFSESFKDPIPDTVEIPEPPASSSAFVGEGRKVFMTMECWACHGVQGKGDGKAAKTLMDSWGHSIRPANFTECRYKGGNDAKSIYRTINTGLNGTPMSGFADAFLFGGDKVLDTANYKGSFSSKEVDELLAYLKSQPAQAAIEGMPEDKKTELAQHRKWALVLYIRSLIQKPSVFRWLFTEDMELTR